MSMGAHMKIFFILAFFGIKSLSAADFHSPRSVALGGAGHAGPLLNDSLYLNPTFASFYPVVGLATNYLWFNGEDNQSGRLYNLSVQDGRTPLFQAGVGYTVREDGALLHLGASKKIVQQLGVGISGKIFFPPQGDQEDAFDLVFSMLGVPQHWVQIGFVIDNLIESETSRARGLLREYILGTKFNLVNILLLYVDPHFIPHAPSGKTFGYEMGIEIAPFSDLFLRMGAFKNSKVPHLGVYGRGFGWGIGWVAPKISIEYGMSRVLGTFNGLPTSTAHTFGGTLYF